MSHKYNISRYTNVIDLESGKEKILFSGVTGCLDKIDGQVSDLFSSRDSRAINRLSLSDLKLLHKRGHLTTLSPDAEIERFKELVAGLHNHNATTIGSGGLILVPSYSCNLECAYCFQKGHPSGNRGRSMPLVLLDAIFEKHLPSLLPGIINPYISLYGGEPFLLPNEKIIRRVLEHAKIHQQMSVLAVTNGTTVDVIADIFGPGAGKVNKVQVSLDGWRDSHDQSRVLSGGGPTFDKILKNIRMLLDRGVFVDIRINLDAHKLSTLPKLIEELKTRGIAGNSRVEIRGYPLHEGGPGQEIHGQMNLSEVSEGVRRLGLEIECPSTLRNTDVRRLFELSRGVGLTRTAYCMQTYQNHLVIDPLGDIYACTEEAGYPEFRIGHVSEKALEFFPLRDAYRRRHLANMPECLACSVALACGGQCGMRCRVKMLICLSRAVMILRRLFYPV